MEKVEVVSSSLVGTARHVSTAISKLELIAWDLRLLQSPCIQRGLLFHLPQSEETLIIIQHLKRSLSRTLDFFPPLAGRLSTTLHDGGAATFSVDCNDAGAEFTHAVAASISVSDIAGPDCTPEFVSSSFFPLNDVVNYEGTSKPLVAVQLTELADGVFIGCAANHAVVDGTSFWHFLNTWSEISRGFPTISKAPVFDRSFTTAAAIQLPAVERNEPPPPPPLPQKVFRFSRESLARLKAKANSEAGTDKISTLQAFLAHLWRSTVRCRRPRATGARIMMAIGARGRNISLAEGYFGNAAYLATMAISEGDLLQKGLGSVALKINELVSQQSEEAARLNVEEKVDLRRLGGASAAEEEEVPVLIVGSSPRHDVYGCDFGWGKPVAVRSGKAQKFNGLLVIFPAAESGGIDVEVCLPPEVLQSMEYDAEFTAAVSTGPAGPGPSRSKPIMGLFEPKPIS